MMSTFSLTANGISDKGPGECIVIETMHQRKQFMCDKVCNLLESQLLMLLHIHIQVTCREII